MSTLLLFLSHLPQPLPPTIVMRTFENFKSSSSTISFYFSDCCISCCCWWWCSVQIPVKLKSVQSGKSGWKRGRRKEWILVGDYGGGGGSFLMILLQSGRCSLPNSFPFSAATLLRLSALGVSAVVEADHVARPRVVLHHKVLLSLQNLR